MRRRTNVPKEVLVRFSSDHTIYIASVDKEVIEDDWPKIGNYQDYGSYPVTITVDSRRLGGVFQARVLASGGKIYGLLMQDPQYPLDITYYKIIL